MSLQLILQIAFSGLLNGIIYGSVGLSFLTVYRITGVINFAQGDLGIIAALAATSLLASTPLPFGIAGGILASGVVGALIYVAILYPMRRASLLTKTIALLGSGIVIQSLLHLYYGTQPHTLPPFTEGSSLMIGGAAFPLQGFWVIGFGILLLVALHVFFDRTRLGKAVRACSVDRYAAGVVGIPVELMGVVSFALGGIIVGAAVAVQAPLSYITIASGLPLALKGFISAIIGSGERILAVMVAGIALGLAESLVILFMPISFQQIFVLAGILVVILVWSKALGASARHA